MARVLCVDYGRKRSGVAVTDPLQIIAGGLTTVATPELYSFLEQYVSREGVERIVIGKPMQPNGQPSENYQRVSQFVQRWRNHHPETPIDFYDERFTSVLAHQAIIEGGVKKKKRREDRGLVDEVSATIILQSWMARRT